MASAREPRDRGGAAETARALDGVRVLELTNYLAGPYCEQVRAREFVVDLRHTTLGTVRATGSPMRLSRTPVRLDRAGPLLGEHTAEVLAELGVSAEELRALVGSGVAACAAESAASGQRA
jgi:crotonobetainyl-CoA:carnitine CoA-transferase CaiB-like acyl-CoA transferase